MKKDVFLNDKKVALCTVKMTQINVTEVQGLEHVDLAEEDFLLNVQVEFVGSEAYSHGR